MVYPEIKKNGDEITKKLGFQSLSGPTVILTFKTQLTLNHKTYMDKQVKSTIQMKKIHLQAMIFHTFNKQIAKSALCTRCHEFRKHCYGPMSYS
jgi:hypothetical protein